MDPSGPDEIKLPIDFSGRYKTIQDMYLTPTKIYLFWVIAYEIYDFEKNDKLIITLKHSI